jgi:CubicO group peptidase (beta-lactamase class C family)
METITKTVTAELDAYFQEQTDARRFSGVVLVAKDSTILLEKGYGFANYATRQANDPAILYKIGSMTKAFVTLSILMLEERGQLCVDNTLDTYIPGFSFGTEVTLHQLMSHTSGVWCYLQDPASPFWDVMDRPHTTQDLMGYMKGRPLNFPPGSQWRYSNSSYVLLGVIIERFSGEPLGDFFRHNIFEPLGLLNTIFDPSESWPPDRLAIGYDHLNLDPPPISRNLHSSVTYATGAMLSTVGDLYKWDQALCAGVQVSKESLNRIFTPGLGNYGYAWWIDSLEVNHQRHKNIWHWGCSSGYHGMLTRLVDDRATIIMLQNFTSPDLLVPESPEALFRLRNGAAAILFSGE